MARHTPGPWLYENIPGKDKHGNVMHLHRIAEKKTNIMIVYMEDKNPANSPNAQLIAAAPELLEACRQALKFYINNLHILPNSELEDVVKIIEGAIRKATGEEV